jgi:hypothetical protein
MRVTGGLVLGAMLFSLGVGWGSAQEQQAGTTSAAAAAAASATQAKPAGDGVTQVPAVVEKPNPLKRRLTDKE